MSEAAVPQLVDERSELLGGQRLDSSSIVTSYGSNAEQSPEAGPEQEEPRSKKQNFDFSAQWSKVLVLMFCAFLVNLDSACLYSVFREIASEFNKLESASWIVNSYVIGIIVSQPLFGKLSDIYGRKAMLIVAYLCTIVGGLVAGSGLAFWVVVTGRTIAGFGSAGISALVSIVIVDLVPMRDVAPWRSYVYALNQIGRALGLPIGGFITDGKDWRWAILFQVPLQISGLVFIWYKLHLPSYEEDDGSTAEASSRWAKVQRIDFGGVLCLGIANCSLLLFLENAPEGAGAFGYMHIIIPLVSWAVFLSLFFLLEGYFVREPILPLRLLMRRNVCSSYAIQFLQTSAQMAVFTSIPLYFRITNGDRTSVTAFRLMPVTIGTFFGNLISGYLIKRTGVYRIIIQTSQLFCIAGLVAIFVRWRGSTSWLETMYGFPVGIGMGVALSAVFIALNAGLEHSKLAVATTGFYMSLNLGSMFGVGIASLLIKSFVRMNLLDHFRGRPNREQLAKDLASNFEIIDGLTDRLKDVVIHAYTRSLIHVWLFAVVCGCLAFAASLIMREGSIYDPKGKTRVREQKSMVERVKGWMGGGSG